MDEKETSTLESILQNSSLDDFDKYILKENKDAYDKLADYLNDYIGAHELILSEIIRNSSLSRDYAYSIFNGHRKNPTRDRVIAICLSCEMSLAEAQRCLKLCNAGILYAKNNRDAAIMICFNRGIYNVDTVNEFLYEHEMDPLKTSKDM